MSGPEPSNRSGEFFVLMEALHAFKIGSLCDDPSDRALARAAVVSPTTIGNWLQGKTFPQDIGKVLVMVRMVRDEAAVRGIASPTSTSAGLLEDDRWRAAHREEARRRASIISGVVQRSQAVSLLAKSAARVRVGEADLRRLGVHAAISVPGVPDEVLPEYVERDVDAAGNGVRDKVAAAAARGGFVLLVGGSSVGKTRCAAEAVKALLPHWWLVHPTEPADVAALAAEPPTQTVIWLDELQRYLDGEHGLTGGVVRALLNAPHPVVLIGTLWPDRHAAYTAVPVPGGPDPRGREREVLDLATVIRISGEFSSAERTRACATAARDGRLKAALEAPGYGLTQTLAAAPQLVARWEDAQAVDPYAWAVLTAALDMARLGVQAPLSPSLLRAAAPGYCTPRQQAEAPANWLEQSLVYATERLHGAASALAPVGANMGHVDGYTVADYLLQHAAWERRAARVSASTWDALLSNVCDPADSARLADSAGRRLLHCYAIPFCRHAADAGDKEASRELARLLAEGGDLDELRARADAGDWYAMWELPDLLAERGDLDEAIQLLRPRADAGDWYAAERLARLSAERGDLERAMQLLRPRADAGDWHAAERLANLLAERGELDELRADAGAGNRHAAIRLANLLVERGGDVDVDEALQITDAILTVRRAVVGERGNLDELRARADAGDEEASRELASLLFDRGDLDELRTRADAGDEDAAYYLACQLAQCGELDEALQLLRALADARHRSAAERLAELLAKRGDLDELRARAEAGEGNAANELACQLAVDGNLDEALQILRTTIADAGEGDAQLLDELLRDHNRGEEAERLRSFGLALDGSIASG